MNTGDFKAFKFGYFCKPCLFIISPLMNREYKRFKSFFQENIKLTFITVHSKKGSMETFLMLKVVYAII